MPPHTSSIVDVHASSGLGGWVDAAAAEDTPSLPPRRSDMALHPSHPPALISRGRPRLMGCGGAFRPSESAEGRFKDRARRKSQGVKALKK